MNNLEILFELAEAKHELELLIDNTLSNLTPYETQLVLKEGLGKNIARGLVGVGLYKYGKSRGNKQGTEQGMVQGKRAGRKEGLQLGVDKGAEMFDLGSDAMDKHFRLRKIPGNIIKRMQGKSINIDGTPYERAHARFKDDPSYTYDVKMDRDIWPKKIRF
jgi:hypothetical protein